MEGIEYREGYANIDCRFVNSNKGDIDTIVSSLKEVVDILSGDQKARVQQFINWIEGDTKGKIKILCDDIDELTAIIGGKVGIKLSGYKQDIPVKKEKIRRIGKHSLSKENHNRIELYHKLRSAIDNKQNFGEIRTFLKSCNELDHNSMANIIAIVKQDLNCTIDEISFLAGKVKKGKNDRQYIEIVRIIESRTI